jgi:hypothetical protein
LANDKRITREDAGLIFAFMQSDPEFQRSFVLDLETSFRLKSNIAKYASLIASSLNYAEADDKIFSRFLNVWYFGIDEKDRKKYFHENATENLQTMIEIENIRPGILMALYKRFGIMQFGRYYNENLINQYDQMDEDGLPFGLVVISEDDWYMQALHEPQLKYNIWEFYRAVNRTGYLRIFECGSKRDVAKMYHKCKRYYPEHSDGSVLFCYMPVHGGINLITFGDEEMPGRAENDLDIDTELEDCFEKYGLRRIGKLFARNAQLILDSCSVASGSGSIAKTLSDYLEMEVIGSPCISYLTAIKPIRRKDSLTFEVSYSAPHEKFLKPQIPGS